MPAYKNCDYVYFNKRIEAPKEYHNQLILYQEPYFYITSLSNVLGETLTFLSNLF